MPAQKLKEFLDRHKIKYVSIHHSTAYAASEIAASAHVKGRNLAKTVIVKLDGKLAMAVLPSKYHVNLERLRVASSSGNVDLAAEEEFSREFPGCDEGAMPPFGNLYGMPVYVDTILTEDEEIAFNACTHTELIQLAYKDFQKLVNPTVAAFRE
ncbi:MAG: YbaK/EbsC family protein [Spirochaetia bacterium]|jgi:Ala-tRNA(Pro) deacylase